MRFAPASFVVLLAACSSEVEPERSTLAPPHVGPPQVGLAETCVECHASQVQDWSRTSMARTLEPTSAQELAGLGSVVDGAGYRYAFEVNGDGQPPLLVETRDERPEHALAAAVLFGIGSGTRDRSYALAHGAGVWFAPVEVLPTGGGREVALAPHAAMTPGSRFTAPITSECLGCHTESLPAPSFPLNARDPEWVPRGISCGACHGESEAHASWQRAEDDGSAAGADPLVFHGQLGRWQRLSVCAACHLQGDARLILNPGELGPPAPGGDLLAQRALFVAREPGDDVGFVSQVERLTRSRCFLESQMTCETCHDPHRSLSQSGERDRVRAACLQCHEPDAGMPKSLGSAPSASRCSRPQSTAIETHSVQLEVTGRQDCASCHLPRTGVFDVAGVTIHDHYIRRDVSGARPPTTDAELRFPESATGDWKRFEWPGQPAPAHLEDPGLWMMAHVTGGYLQRARDLVDSEPGPVARRLPMYHHLRAGLLEGLDRPEDAALAYERVLALEASGAITPDAAPSAINLGLLLANLGKPAEGLALLDRVIERYPTAEGALRNRGVLRAAAGDLIGAHGDLERAFQALPSAAVADSLAKLAAALSDPQSVQGWRRAALQLEPLRDPATGR